jgi:hypothetical protein
MIAGSSEQIGRITEMTEGLISIITQLERQKSAIERALVALREAEGVAALNTAAPASAVNLEASKPEAAARKGKKRSAEVRKRMREAQQLRWAKIKGESKPSTPVSSEAPKPKRRISEEGRRNIIAATKKRWALKRAEAQAALKTVKTKQIARKKAA